MTIAMSPRWVERLRGPAQGRAEHFDADTTGLVLRVTAAHKKTWYAQYRVAGDAQRKKRRKHLGAYPVLTLADARAACRSAVAEALAGRDPAEPAAAPAVHGMAFEALARQYLERHAKEKKASWKEDEARLTRTVIPAWTGRQAQDIRRRDVVAVLDQVLFHGRGVPPEGATSTRRRPVEANRTLAVVRKVFNWGIARDLVEVNPCAGAERPADERSRERCLDDAELQALWKALEAVQAVKPAGPGVAAVFRLCLLTAQRSGEVMAMRWADISGPWWTQPGPATKNRREHRVYLASDALAVVEAQRERRGDSDWVFPSWGAGGHITTVKKSLAAIRQATGLEFTVHDLRRTAATRMRGDCKVSRFIVGQVLGHTEQGVTGVYDRSVYDDEKRAALEKWSARLIVILAQKKPVRDD